jgi:hypothetical protein
MTNAWGPAFAGVRLFDGPLSRLACGESALFP